MPDTQIVNENITLSRDSSEPSCSWNQVVNKRKMTDLSSSNMINKVPRGNTPKVIPTNTQSLPLSNRFDALATNKTDNAMEDSEDPPETKSHRPPPIFLNSDVHYISMCNLLKSVIGDNFKCATSTKGVTLYVSTPDAYRTCVRYLKSQNADFHSYQLSEDKPFRVVIRGLHPSIDHNVLKEELKEKGHIVRSVSNVLSREKEKLPLFFVDLEIAENNEDIFELDVLMYSKIKVESPRPKRQLAQCTRCQQYGHTKTYCNHPHKCVRCAGNHDSTSCEKPKETPATCALCGESHPSNYKGCTVYKDLQKRRSPAAPPARPLRQRQHSVPNARDERLFPQLKQPTVTDTLKQTPSHSPTINDQQTNTSFSANSNPSPTYSQATTNGDITHQLNNFITEMKSLLTPLITLVNQLIQALITQNGNK